MTIRPRWENHIQSEEYLSDADAYLRWEALHAVFTTSSNEDANAYGQPSVCWQVISPLMQFFNEQGTTVRARFGEEAWTSMMELATECSERLTTARSFFEAIPEDLSIHNLRREDFQPTYKRKEKDAPGAWMGDWLFHNGLKFCAFGESLMQVQTEAGELVKEAKFPDEVWIEDIWLSNGQIYLPCRSYCLPTVVVRYDKGLVARSAIGHWMDPLPVGVWNQLKTRM